MISFDALQAGYRPPAVLKGISATAKQGELIALIGPNGCGKSTLLKTLCGIINPSSGTITLDGKPLISLSLKERAKSIAYLAQSRDAMPAMSVRDVVQLGRAPYRGALGKISSDGQTAIDEAMQKTQSDVFAERRFDELSGGEQARVLLARALAVQAPILLADEPIAALDPFYQLSMMGTLRAEADSGKTVITALHDLSLAAQFANRIWVMYGGRIIASDTPLKALTDDTLKTVFGIRSPKGGFKPLELSD